MSTSDPVVDTRPSDRGEILWDSFGVPHIYGSSVESMLKGYGFSQMENHAELLLGNVAVARGRTAEYWGAGPNDQNVNMDIGVRTLGIPGRAAIWRQKSSDRQKRYVEAFVAGANQYAQKYLRSISPSFRVVLPLIPEDVFSLLQCIVQFQNFRFREKIRSWQSGDLDPAVKHFDITGSNGWALAPAKTIRGNAILVGSLHWPWATGKSATPGSNFFQWFEAQLIVGDPCQPQLSATGATLVGLPFVAIGFNDYLGWTLTANSVQNSDLYELSLKSDEYEWEHTLRKLDHQVETIAVRETDGTVSPRLATIYSSVHGPIVARRGNKALALRVTGLDAFSIVTQFWDMMLAVNVSEFNNAISLLQLPRYNFIYADARGEIQYIFNGLQPIRQAGNYQTWSKILPGHDSRLLSKGTLPWASLPKLHNPPGGFVQNSNDPPWTSTFPQVLKPSHFPPYIAPEVTMLRSQAIANALLSKKKLSLNDVMVIKESTKMLLADRVITDLITAARESAHPIALAAANLLESWDRTSDNTSSGSVLFDRWLQLYTSDAETPRSKVFGETYPAFTVEWSPEQPLSTPYGLATPAAAIPSLIRAAQQLDYEFGRFDITWGEVHRAILTTWDDSPTNIVDISNTPISGSGDIFGTVRALEFSTGRDDPNLRIVHSGETYTQIVEFTQHGPSAWTLLSYGNASRPNSEHISDQLPYFASKQLKPAWRSRFEVEDHTVKSELLE